MELGYEIHRRSPYTASGMLQASQPLTRGKVTCRYSTSLVGQQCFEDLCTQERVSSGCTTSCGHPQAVYPIIINIPSNFHSCGLASQPLTRGKVTCRYSTSLVGQQCFEDLCTQERVSSGCTTSCGHPQAVYPIIINIPSNFHSCGLAHFYSFLSIIHYFYHYLIASHDHTKPL